MRLGFGELVVVLVVVLLVFGPNKLPQLGDALGKTIRSFRQAANRDDSIDGTSDKAGRPQLTGATASSSAAGESRRAAAP